MNPIDLLTVAVLLFFAWRMLVNFRYAVSGKGQSTTRVILRGMRLRHFLPVPFVLATVVGAAQILTSIPPLDFGWWTAIGGQGNPAFGLTERTVGTPLGTIVPMMFVVLLVPALPLLVLREEEIFRLGAESWSWPRRVGMVLGFGLVHALVGIPIGVAIALSIGGAYFMAYYLWAWDRTRNRTTAVSESTRRHLAYNATVVGIVVLVLAGDAVLHLIGAV